MSDKGTSPTGYDIVTLEVLKKYFPALEWEILDDRSAQADIPLNDDIRFIDPSIEIYRHESGEYQSKLYLNDGLQFAGWSKTSFEESLVELKEQMVSLKDALNNAL
jgi:hypothetical protein